MPKKKITEGPSTRHCLTKDCNRPCEGRSQYCRPCRKARYTEAGTGKPHTMANKICTNCKQERDCEEFIRSTTRNEKGHSFSHYRDECDTCVMTRDWANGIFTTDTTNMIPFERAKREVAYEYRVVPNVWMNRTNFLAELHTLLMFKYGKFRDENIDERIADVRRLIARYGTRVAA